MKRALHGVCVNPVKRMANSPAMLVVGVLGSIVVGCVAFMLFEGVAWYDGIYWTTTTMTSVGYGDLLATSPGAKLFTSAFQLWSLFVLVPCAVANIVSGVLVVKDKLTHREQEYMMKALRLLAEERGLTELLGPEPHDYLEDDEC